MGVILIHACPLLYLEIGYLGAYFPKLPAFYDVRQNKMDMPFFLYLYKITQF